MRTEKALKTIVAATDFSSGGFGASLEAVRLAEWHQGKVHVVHVVDEVMATEIGEHFLPSYQGGARKGLADDARGAWEATVKSTPALGVAAFEVRVAPRVRGILSFASGLKADLLVIGAWSERTPDVGMGTVATACVRSAACDVLIVRDSHEGKFTRVTACIDFSDTSLKALERAIDIASRDGAAIDVLHVYWTPTNLFPFSEAVRSAIDEEARKLQADAEKTLSYFCEPLKHELAYLKAEMHCVPLNGSPGRTIAEFARGRTADLIALGTRGKTNLRDVFLGSTAERLLRATPCSVLAVKPEGPHDPMGAHDREGAPQSRTAL